MRYPTKYIANFQINDGEKQTKESPNLHILIAEVRRHVREQAGVDGTGYFEVFKIFTDEERKARRIPEKIKGQVNRRSWLKNGKWKLDTPFKEYF